MSIFTALSGFVRRHKRKIIFATAASASLYFLVNQFIVKRIRDFQNSLKQELYVKEQIKRRFIQTQTDCYLTILALLPVLSHPLMSYLPTETITAALKRKKAPSKEMSDSLTTENLIAHSGELKAQDAEMSAYVSKSKLELWNDLKVKSITRMLALIYSSSALLLLTRLQLNILARKSYLELAIAMAGGSVEPAPADSFTYFVEQSYLSLSWWLLNNGNLRFADKIETYVEEKFKEISPKTELSVDTFHLILNEINSEALGQDSHYFLGLIFPVDYDELIQTVMNTNPELVNELENKDLNLVKLIQETIFIFENDFTLSVYASLVQSGVQTLCDNILEILNPDNNTSRTSKLATFLAQLSVQSTVILNTLTYGDSEEAMGNVYINSINDLEELDEFSAGIYSNFE